MKSHFGTFAGYNAWANHRLYEAVAQVPDAHYHEDRGAFFGSLHGTLNHILVGDRAWLHRITGNGTPPASLDQILYGDFASLRQARIAEDERIIRVVGGLDAARLAGTITYRNMRGDHMEQQLAEVLAHVFNHQTHHRGQAHTLVSQLGYEAPALDLVYFVRE
ncbi:MAG: DinB family protein [Alphaproteobacteria bacterium]